MSAKVVSSFRVLFSSGKFSIGIIFGTLGGSLGIPGRFPGIVGIEGIPGIVGIEGIPGVLGIEADSIGTFGTEGTGHFGTEGTLGDLFSIIIGVITVMLVIISFKLFCILLVYFLIQQHFFYFASLLSLKFIYT